MNIFLGKLERNQVRVHPKSTTANPSANNLRSPRRFPCRISAFPNGDGSGGDGSGDNSTNNDNEDEDDASSSGINNVYANKRHDVDID